jgi:hypothetical protein
MPDVLKTRDRPRDTKHNTISCQWRSRSAALSPFFIGQGTRISQFATVVSPPVFRRPHGRCPRITRRPRDSQIIKILLGPALRSMAHVAGRFPIIAPGDARSLTPMILRGHPRSRASDRESLPHHLGDARKGLSQTGRSSVAQAMLRRVCRPSLKFATATKRHEIARLLEVYRGGVNFYVGSLWQNAGALDKKTLARLPPERTRLRSMQKDQALAKRGQSSPPRVARQGRSAPNRRARVSPAWPCFATG